MQPCKLIMTTASNTANLQFLGITKASCHGHINIITVFHSTNFKFAGVYCWSSCGKKKKDFLIFLVNVLLLDYLESISLAYMSQPSLCVLTRLNEWCWLGQTIVNN